MRSRALLVSILLYSLIVEMSKSLDIYKLRDYNKVQKAVLGHIQFLNL